MKKPASLEKNRLSAPAPAGTAGKATSPATTKPAQVSAASASAGKAPAEKKAPPRTLKPSEPVKLSPARQTVVEGPAGLLVEHVPTPQRPSAHLEFYNPTAFEVFVAGSFNDWEPRATPMRKRGKGEWTADLTLQPGRYEYRFVVDGKWVEDPRASAFAANPFGGQNAVLQIG